MVFKTIESSIDKSRTSLALFNKDWNIFKTNWQNASGGLKNKFTTIFNSNDVNCLKEYNSQIQAGIKPSVAYRATMMGCTQEAKKNAVAMAKGSMTYEQATSSIKGATVALKALSIAGNMIAFMAIAKGIQLVADVIDNVVHAQEKAIEKAEESINKIKEEQDALISNKKTIDSISSDYEKLSKGVDDLGRNVSLNTDEYSRYNDIVNQIADMFPQMIRGYTEEGNAIIAHKGSVEALTKAYEDQKKAAQDAIIVGSADVFAGYKAKVDNVADFFGEEYGLIQKKEQLELAKEILSYSQYDTSSEELNRLVSKFINTGLSKTVLKEAGIDEWSNSFTGVFDILDKNRTKVLAYLNTISSEIEAETTKIKPIMQAYLEQSFEFQGLDEKTQDIVKHIVGQFDSEFYSQFDNETEMASWITENIVNKFKGKDGEKMSIEFGAMFDLQTQFNTNKITVSEYQEKLSAFLTLIGSLPDETQKAIKLLFGIQTNEDGTTTSDTDTMINNVKDKLSDEFDGKVGELSLGDLKIASELKIDDGTLLSWDELIAKIEEVKNASPDKTDISLGIPKTIDQLNTRLKPSMDSLKSAWQDIFTEDEFSLDNLDLLSTVDSIKSKLDELNKIDGITVDYSSFEDFVRILENTESTEEDVKQGFNELASSIVQASVSGIEDFQTLKEVLEDLGVVNNDIVAFEALAQNIDALKSSGLDLLNATQFSIKAFASERVSAENLSEAIAFLTKQQEYLRLQKEFNSLQDMDSSQEISNLKKLAESAGITGDIISELTELEQIYQAVASGVYGTNNQQVAMAMERARQLQKKISEGISEINLKPTEVEIEYAPKIDKSSAEKSAKDLEKLTKDYVDAYMTYMEQSLETGRIDYQTYSRDVAKFLKDMYNQGKIAAKDYHDYTKQMLTTQKSIYDKAINAVVRRYDTEIDKINKVIDGIEKQNDALQKQLDNYDGILSVVDSVYEKQIQTLENEKDLLQDKIDSINDTNDALDLQYRKEQALYELKRAQEQRTKKVFNGTQFVYETDQNTIRDAQQTLQDIETEELINNLEKEQEAIDKSISELEKYRDLWAEISDAYDKEINKQLTIALWGKGYDKRILSNRLSDIKNFKDKYIFTQKQINDNQGLIDSYNEKIEYYENLKDQWSSLVDEYENSVEEQYAAMLLGQNWEADVLSGRLDKLNDFRNQYISIQQAIANAAWASANEQVRAAQEAAKGADGSIDDSPDIKSELDKNKDANSRFNITYGDLSGFKQKLNDVEKYGASAVIAPKINNNTQNTNNNTGILDKYYEKLKRGSKYASGTKNAKKGLNLVGEDGVETYIDNNGNVSLVTEPTLIPMEGGEIVKNESETKTLLNGSNLIPLQTSDLFKKLSVNMPDLSSMFKTNIPDYSNLVMRNNNVQQPSIVIGNIHLHEVQNVPDFAKALQKHLPNISVQYNGKH